MALENATDRQEYRLNEDGLIVSWTQINLGNEETAQFQCQYDDQKYLIRVLDAEDSAELMSITWENGEMVSGRLLFQVGYILATF